MKGMLLRQNGHEVTRHMVTKKPCPNWQQHKRDLKGIADDITARRAYAVLGTGKPFVEPMAQTMGGDE